MHNFEWRNFFEHRCVDVKQLQIFLWPRQTVFNDSYETKLYFMLEELRLSFLMDERIVRVKILTFLLYYSKL